MATATNTTVFCMGGKTYIGRVLSSSQVDTKAMGTITSSLGAASTITDGGEYVFISKPALVEFTLEETASKNYELKWKITPLMFKTLLQSSSAARNVFLFRKNDIAFSGMTGDNDLIAELVAAYKELV